MTAKIIDGKTISEDLLHALKQQVDKQLSLGMRAPSLAVVLIGNDPASAIYVRNKRRACEKVGIHSISHDLPATTSETELFDLIKSLNKDTAVDGILVQSPLPEEIDEAKLIEYIDPNKDVDGFHPYNIGRLAVRQPILRSCTPYGVIKMLQTIDQPIRGMDAVVVGVSNHVGRPMALELLLAGCTVTSCHRHTKDLAGQIKKADLVIAAAGKPSLIKGEWIKEGAVVVDIGINRLPSGKLAGDVDFDAACKKASWITPVPGGVGPMTVATLMQNTVLAQSMLVKD